MSSCYDLIIVGAGAAGVRTGIEVVKQYPGIRCCLLEKYNYVGGRIVTYRKDIPSIGPVQWENGAGRISRSHTRVLRLVRQYGLHTFPLSPTTCFVSSKTHDLQPNTFYDLLSIFILPLRRLSKDVLATHTVEQLLIQTIGIKHTKELAVQFPYYSELHVLRADLALDAFEKEMGSNKGFVVCAEGYQAITDHMVDEFVQRGGILLTNFDVTEVRSLQDHSVQIVGRETICPKGKKTIRTIQATGVVLALPSTSLQSIKGIVLPMLRHLEMPPLLRIYAIFPRRNGKIWFEHLSKVVTDSTLRYIIPYDVKKGIIMISYTEGPDASYWMKMSPAHVQKEIYFEVQRLFPDLDIPPPLFVKMHPWTDGCTYWKPGAYDPVEESQRSLQPLPDTHPHVFVCSESFSLHQSWVESALEQADQVLALPAFQAMLQT